MIQLELPSRPNINIVNNNDLNIKCISLKSNMIPLEIATISNSQSNLTFYLYQIKPQKLSKVQLALILKESRQEFEKNFERYFIQNGILYSTKKSESPSVIIEATINNLRFSLYIDFKREISINLNELIQEGNQIFDQNGNAQVKCLSTFCKSLIKYQNNYENNIFEQTPKIRSEQKMYQIQIKKRDNCKIFIASQKLFLSVDQVTKSVNKNNINRFLKQFNNFKEKNQQMKGKKICTLYNQYVYEIGGLDYNKCPKSEFYFQRQQTRISFEDYYLSKYKLQIQDQKQRLLVHYTTKIDPQTKIKKSKKIYLIPEFCFFLDMHPNQQQKNKYFVDAQKKPNKIYNEKVQQPIDFLNKQQHIFTDQLGLQLKISQNNVNGFKLQPPLLTLQNKQEIKIDPATPLINLNQQITNFLFKEWIFIYPKGEKQIVEQLLQLMQVAGQTMGITIIKPSFIEMKKKDLSDFSDLLKQEFNKNKIKKPQFVLSYVPQNHTYQQTFYEQIKYYIYKVIGIQHQHVNRKLSKISFVSQLVLQIANKLGKKLWSMSSPQGLSANTMLIGISSSRRNQNQNQNFLKLKTVSVVSSIDQEMSKFYSRIYQQKETDTTISVLSTIIANSINQYANNMKELPDEIVIYRKGLADGELPSSKEYEINSIIEGFKQINKEYKPRFIFFTVNKKVCQRFYQNTQDSNQQLSNPESGTIISEDITRNKFDFFLCSVDQKNGTCKPTSYKCLYSDTELTEQCLWQLTYNQCFNYVNSIRPVKVPAPLMYANKLLKFSAKNMIDKPTDSFLSQSLYYV